MKNRLISIIVALTLCMVFALPAFAASDGSELLFDNADVLTEEEETSLKEKLAYAKEHSNSNIAVLTVNSFDGKDMETFSDDFYDSRFGDTDGTILVYKHGVPGDRDIYISTAGSAIEVFSDKRLDEVLDYVQNDIVDENYYEAFLTYADMGLTYMQNGPENPTVAWYWIPLSIVIGFAVAFISLKAVTSNLKSVRSQTGARSYIRNDSFELKDKADYFIYSSIAKTPKPKPSDNDSHVSSSGVEHGGKGRSSF